MAELNSNNQEVRGPQSTEEIEAARLNEVAQKEAADFAHAKEAEATQSGVRFEGRPSEHLSEQTGKILQFRPAEKAKAPEAVISDHTQVFIDRLVNSKTDAERKAVMNEVLAASLDGKILPNEASELLSRANELPNITELPKAA